ncbi:MAG: PP2C family protein-serine/threonine phosphatase [Comamonas sp.]
MPSTFRLLAATGLHQGDRAYQQDQLVLLPHPRAHGCLLGLVADGMGGRSGGRLAADQVVITARQVFERFAPGTDDAVQMLERLASEAHLLIRLIAISAEQEPHSTLAVFVITPQGECAWAHAGDSRLYHFRNGKLVFHTSDHSYVQTLVDQGEITLEEARDHPQSNILLNCLGTARDPQITIHRIPQLRKGDALLACSDGIWHHFDPGALAAVLQTLSPREACEFLVERAHARAGGSGDNMSLIALKVDKPETAPADSTPPRSRKRAPRPAHATPTAPAGRKKAQL